MSASAPTVTTATATVDSRPVVQVTVSYSFKTITSFPGVPKNETLVRRVTMRVVPATPN